MADHAQRAIATMIVAMGLFSLSDVFSKRLAASGLPVVEIVWFRYLVLALTVGYVAWRRRERIGTARWPLQALRGVCIVASAVVFNAALARLPVGMATSLAFSSPLFVVALSTLVLKEPVAGTQWLFVVIGFVGVVIVANPGAATFEPAALLPIGSSIAWAVAMIITRAVTAADGAFTTQSWTCAIGLAVLSVLGLWVGFAAPTPAQYVELAAMGVCWSAAQWMAIHAYGHSEPGKVAAFAYSQLVWAHALGLVLLGQWPTSTTLAGTAVIAAAGIGAARSAGRT